MEYDYDGATYLVIKRISSLANGHYLNIIIIAGMTVFYVAGYLIEERRRWPVITASPRGLCSKTKQIQNFEGKACSDEKTLPVTWSDEKLILLYGPVTAHKSEGS